MPVRSSAPPPRSPATRPCRRRRGRGLRPSCPSGICRTLTRLVTRASARRYPGRGATPRRQPGAAGHPSGSAGTREAAPANIRTPTPRRAGDRAIISPAASDSRSSAGGRRSGRHAPQRCGVIHARADPLLVQRIRGVGCSDGATDTRMRWRDPDVAREEARWSSTPRSPVPGACGSLTSVDSAETLDVVLRRRSRWMST